MDIFDPVKLSIQENEFILRHAGEPWVVAGRDIHPVPLANPHKKDRNPVHYPDGVVPAAVRPIIDRIYELNELEQHKGEKWVGVEVIKAAALAYLQQARLWEAQKGRKGAIRFPSMWTFNSKGRPAWSAPGSDSGQVKTYFNEKGERVPFAVPFIPEEEGWKPEWMEAVARADQPVPSDGLKVDETLNRIECLICNHTESFKPESRASFNAARGRISKHLRSATVDPDRHREVHSLEFGSGGSAK